MPATHPNSRHYANNEEMMAHVREVASSMKGATALFAGHYRLYLSRETGLISEAVYATLKDVSQTGYFQLILSEMGQFPEQTLLWAAQLIKAKIVAEDSKIWLVANDVFRRYGQLQPGLPQDGREIHRLRQAYYRSQTTSWFMPVLEDEGISVDILHPNNAKRRSEHTLPSKSLLFSERVFENSFENRIRRKEFLAGRTVAQQDTARLLSCRMTGSECQCSKTMLEILLQMHEANYRNVLLFIPYACKDSVSDAITEAQSSLRLFDKVMAVYSARFASDDTTIAFDTGEVW